jgi:hypothetical protein
LEGGGYCVCECMRYIEGKGLHRPLCRCKSMMSVAKRGLGVVDFPDFGCSICNMKIGTVNSAVES